MTPGAAKMGAVPAVAAGAGQPPGLVACQGLQRGTAASAREIRPAGPVLVGQGTAPMFIARPARRAANYAIAAVAPMDAPRADPAAVDSRCRVFRAVTVKGPCRLICFFLLFNPDCILFQQLLRW